MAKRDIPMATLFLVLAAYPVKFIYDMAGGVGNFFLFLLYYEVFTIMLKNAIARYFPVDD